jgi:hypothetical protein
MSFPGNTNLGVNYSATTYCTQGIRIPTGTTFFMRRMPFLLLPFTITTTLVHPSNTFEKLFPIMGLTTIKY